MTHPNEAERSLDPVWRFWLCQQAKACANLQSDRLIGTDSIIICPFNTRDNEQIPSRMKLKLPQMVEVESSHQQLALVAAGIGWTITTPVCLAAVQELLPQLRAEPMTRGRFSRAVQVVARTNELGDIPRLTANLCQQILREKTFPPLIAEYPWIEQQLVWPSATVEGEELIA